MQVIRELLSNRVLLSGLIGWGTAQILKTISVIVAIIVMHDAMGVRLETGKQAKLLNEFIDLFAKLEQPLSDQEKLKELVGHTPLQVCMGGLLGIATGILCNLGA